MAHNVSPLILMARDRKLSTAMSPVPLRLYEAGEEHGLRYSAPHLSEGESDQTASIRGKRHCAPTLSSQISSQY